MPAADALLDEETSGQGPERAAAAEIADRRDRQRDDSGNRRHEECARGEADRSDQARHRDVQETFAGAVGIHADPHHSDRGAEVRNRRYEPHLQVVQSRQAFDDLRYPQREPITARLAREHDQREQPHGRMQQRLAQTDVVAGLRELLFPADVVDQPLRAAGVSQRACVGSSGRYAPHDEAGYDRRGALDQDTTTANRAAPSRRPCRAAAPRRDRRRRSTAGSPP